MVVVDAVVVVPGAPDDPGAPDGSGVGGGSVSPEYSIFRHWSRYHENQR